MPSIFRRAVNFVSPVALFASSQERASERAEQAAQQGSAQALNRFSAAYQPYRDRANVIDPALENRYAEYLNREPGQDYAQAASDPMGLISALMEQYRASPLSNYKREAALSGMRQTAASGGYGGLENEMAQQGQMASLFADEDIMKWVEALLNTRAGGLAGLQGQSDAGLAGLENISGRGFVGAGNVGGAEFNTAQQQGQIASTGIADRARVNRDLINAIIGGGGQLFGANAASAAGAQGGRSGQFGVPYSFNSGRR